MWTQGNSMWRLVRKVGILMVLAFVSVTLHTETGATVAINQCYLRPGGLWECVGDTDCFQRCDRQFYNPSPNIGPPGCADTCCVFVTQTQTWDCSACPDCQTAYVACINNCFTNEGYSGMNGGGACINISRCERQASGAYKDCVLNAPAYGCAEPDGSVDQACCEGASLVDFNMCCSP